MSIPVEELEKEEDLDISAKIMAVFDSHPGGSIGSCRDFKWGFCWRGSI